MAQDQLQLASQLSIYNMSLGHLPVAPLTSLNTGGNALTILNSFWDAAVQETLRAAPWGFNTTYQSLNQSATYTLLPSAAMANWSQAYSYPQGCIKVWKILAPVSGTSIVGVFPGIYPNTSVNSWNGFNMQRAKYQVRYDPINDQVVILTNVAQAIAEYSVSITDVSLWDAVFVRCLSLRLAAYICPGLVNDDAKTAALIQLAQASASDAMRINDEESPTDKNQESSSFLDARGGGGPVSPQFWNSPSTSQY